MIDMNKAIDHMKSLKGISYSMTGSRTGTDGTGDCSGTVYASLRKAGATDAGWVLNTDSMHDWLVKNGFELIAENQEWEAKRGDIVIFGPKGASGGAAGHVVIFTSQYRIIHCTWKDAYRNGIYEDDSETTCPYDMGFYVYRLKENKVEEKKWVQEDGKWKLLDGTKYYTGWQKVNGKWYYLGTDGIMKTGWQIIDHKWYKLDGSGAMVEGWLKEGNTWYYLESSGAMKTGWFKDKANNWYYLSKPNGAMVTGTVPIDGKTYQFDKNGVCQNP